MNDELGQVLRIMRRVSIAAVCIMVVELAWVLAMPMIVAPAPVQVDAEFPEKLQFLFEPHRYKVGYGGRGGSKSWGFGRALLLQGSQRPLRILCARENQNSIAESVHQLLEDQIKILKLQAHYRVQKAAILGYNGTQFAFAGLRHNIDNIKSLESYDIVWVEEANNVSKASWDKLIPTIRKEGSEIWISFNPELETDETYQRFVVHPPPDAVVVKVNFSDNPWFPEVLRREMEHLRTVDPEDYQHIYEGHCKTAVTGAVYGNEMRQAQSEGRITKVPYDRLLPVHTFWDLGWDDTTTIWLAQYGAFQYRLIDYIEGRHRKFHDYLRMLQERPYVYGFTFLPHDAKAKELGSGKSIEELARVAGCKVKVVRRLSISDGINAARTIFPQCYFDQTHCADGINALRHYRWPDPAHSGAVPHEPLHDWASHASDGFRYFAVSAKDTDNASEDRSEKSRPPARMDFGEDSWMA